MIKIFPFGVHLLILRLKIIQHKPFPTHDPNHKQKPPHFPHPNCYLAGDWIGDLLFYEPKRKTRRRKSPALEIFPPQQLCRVSGRLSHDFALPFFAEAAHQTCSVCINRDSRLVWFCLPAGNQRASFLDAAPKCAPDNFPVGGIRLQSLAI